MSRINYQALAALQQAKPYSMQERHFGSFLPQYCLGYCLCNSTCLHSSFGVCLQQQCIKSKGHKTTNLNITFLKIETFKIVLIIKISFIVRWKAHFRKIGDFISEKILMNQHFWEMTKLRKLFVKDNTNFSQKLVCFPICSPPPPPAPSRIPVRLYSLENFSCFKVTRILIKLQSLGQNI